MKKHLIGLLVIATVGCNNPGSTVETKKEVAAINGEQLFKINCSQCHKPAEELIGPALKNVTARWKDQHLLYDFVRNSQSVIQKDDYAKALFEKYHQSPMMPMPQLSDEEIKAIFVYCDESN